MHGNGLLLFPILFPMLMGLLIGTQKQERRRNGFVLLTVCVEFLVVLYLCFGEYALTVWQMTDKLDLAYHTDDMAKFFAVLISGIWILAAIFSFSYMKHEQNPERFFLFYTMTLGALMSLCFSNNMMTLYLSYEYMTLLTFPLVIHTKSVDAVRAGMKYLGYSIFGAGLGLLGFFFLNSYCITTSFIPGGSLNGLAVAGNEMTLLVVYLLMMIGFGCKAGMFPLQAWLPTAHPVAPSPASAVLSGIITKGGVIAILRVTFYLVGADFVRGTWVQTTLLVLSTLTIFMGSMLAYKERLLKKRLAYSTVSQVSYVLFGIFLLHPIGFLGALLQVVYHAIAKNILFFCAGAMIFRTEKTVVTEYSGLGKKMPVTMTAFTIASLSLIGIPPVAGFVSKWYLAECGLLPISGSIGVVGVVILMVSALLTAGYLLPIVLDAFFKKAEAFDTVKEASYCMTIPLVLLSVVLVLGGIFPFFFIQYIGGISGVLF